MPEPVGQADMDAATLRQVLGLVQRHTGMALADSKQGLLQTRLRRRMRALGIDSYHDYVHRVAEDPGEVPGFVDVVTTHQTSFFRTPGLWRHFCDVALPQWCADHPGERLRIWSAAASTGEEACTIAMCCAEARRTLRPDLAWEIQCTDVSAPAIEHARQGCYGGKPVQQFQQAHQALFQRYNASQQPGSFSLPAPLRATLRHGQHHLLHPSPWPGQFDFVFLRNVLIYFDGSDLHRIAQEARRSLRPQGLLMLGESESLSSVPVALRYLRPQVYQRTEA